MMKLTPEQRREIYEEEKRKIEGEGSGAPGGLLFLTVVAVLSLIGLVSLSKQQNQPKMENIRRAYSGIDSEEYN